MTKILKYKPHPKNGTYKFTKEQELDIHIFKSKWDRKLYHRVFSNKGKYGFAVSKLNPLYYNLIYNNSQWREFNKLPKNTIKAIFRVYEKYERNVKRFNKIYPSPFSNSFKTENEIAKEYNTIRFKCFKCNDIIELNNTNLLNINSIHCTSCKNNNKILFRNKDYLLNATHYIANIFSNINKNIFNIEQEQIKFIIKSNKRIKKIKNEK